MGEGRYIVVDLGKTLSKVSLWTGDGRILNRQVRPNAAVEEGGLRRLDVHAIGHWLIGALAEYADHPVEAIIPVGHGAAVVALVDDHMAFLPLDYEQDLSAHHLAEYRAERDAFALTGSPALPGGLNLGAQLYLLEQVYPAAMARATLVPWAQYWAWFLCGEARSEITTLGCHSDLWHPEAKSFSPLADRKGWGERFAPFAHAGEQIGFLRRAIADQSGLSARVAVHAGMHDSNAALLAARSCRELSSGDATILSTGTWFVAMRSPEQGEATPSLPEGRDCLVNVDVDGRPVPSARFMGGREIETVAGPEAVRVDHGPDQSRLLAAAENFAGLGTMILPTFAPGNGPFAHAKGEWLGAQPSRLERSAGACIYAALVADASLDLIGAKERILVEGRFAAAAVFVRSLARLRPDLAVCTSPAHIDASFGALCAIDRRIAPGAPLHAVAPLDVDLETYRTKWRAAIADRIGSGVAR
ncbi:carbohydrate kinase [Sphingopyxis sp. DHUNG17]|uniref:FGGY-family carbohydrate kinase n=1 Tax=Sphingopyxis jiangsuensis TaxID=2871171 RepID=UPI00191F03A4|nr:carbohydrate kinase [Sphingopyxis lutea]MBL0768519.1 carbohydrate kinase [Sphingopyxis lutea]